MSGLTEAAVAVGSALDDWIKLVTPRNDQTTLDGAEALDEWSWSRAPTHAEVQEAMRANNALAAALAASGILTEGGDAKQAPGESLSSPTAEGGDAQGTPA